MKPFPGKPATGSSPLKILMQGVFFFACLGLLVWVIWRAFADPKNREQIEHLKAAPALDVAMMLACSLATIVIGGLVFRAVLSGEKTIRRRDIVALNGFVSVISYLPFKIGLAFRVYWHHRHDGLPLLTIAGWFAATAGLILSGLFPPLVVSFWRGSVDALWWVCSLGGIAVLGVLIVVMARVFAGEAGLLRIAGLAKMTRLGFLQRFVAGARFRHLHGGIRMLASPAGVGEALCWRVVDIAAQATRLYVAARVCGVNLEPGQAVIAGTTYFFLQAAAPSGVAGLREGGTVGAMAALGLPDLSVVVLTASVAEAVMNVVMAALGGLWLRFGYPERRSVPENPAEAPAAGAGHSSS